MCVCVCLCVASPLALLVFSPSRKEKKKTEYFQPSFVSVPMRSREKKKKDLIIQDGNRKKNGRQARCKEVTLGDADKALLRGLTALHHFPSMCFLWLDERRAEHRLRKKESRNRAMLRVEVKG